jgi:putative addiction module component (TIGR02574 family)
MPTANELEAEVLRLSPPERARILERLLESFELEADSDEAWISEALRREEEVQSGKVSLLSGAEVVAGIRSRIS